MASKKAPKPKLKADPRPLAKDGTRRGGARLGAGRKTAAAKLAKADLRTSLVEKIAAKSEAILEAMFTLAMGAKVADADEDDGFYVTPPDRQACEYLLNQAIGRPTERKEVSGPEGQPIPVAIVSVIDKVYGKKKAAG